MGLILSPRFRRGDLDHWRRREAMDRIYAERCAARLDQLEAEAIATIAAFAARGPCYVGVSWGKDSVAVAHLAASIPGLRFVYFVHAPRDNPDCGAVRDAFLPSHPIDYLEHRVDPRQPGDTTSKAARYARWVREAGLPTRRITGVRADESKVRELSAWTHGDTTATTCRPILHWTAADVFACLYRHDLPVHPAYAQSMAGALDRAWLRVAPLGGKEGTGHGRAEWERRYYPEVAHRG